MHDDNALRSLLDEANRQLRWKDSDARIRNITYCAPNGTFYLYVCRVSRVKGMKTKFADFAVIEASNNTLPAVVDAALHWERTLEKEGGTDDQEEHELVLFNEWE